MRQCFNHYSKFSSERKKVEIGNQTILIRVSQIGMPDIEHKMNYGTVIGSQSGSLHSKWISQYLRHFSTEMAEIWSPGTFFEDVWTHKISALYHLYFQTYETFSRNH